MKCRIILLLILGITFTSNENPFTREEYFKKKKEANNDVCSWAKEELETREIGIFSDATEAIKKDMKICQSKLNSLTEISDMIYESNKDQCREFKDEFHFFKRYYRVYFVLCEEAGLL